MIHDSEFLQDLWRQRDDLHEAALAQLARDRPEHARADRLALVVDEHGGVAVEADVAAVAAALLLDGADDDRLHHLPLLDVALRGRFLDRSGDDVAEPRVAAGRPADRIDDRDLARAGVVGDVQDRSHLNHGGLLDLHRFTDDFLQRPALAAAERTRFDDLHGVADLRRVLLVVDHELRRPALGLAVEAVTDLPLDGDDAALLHPVADDDANFFRFRRHLSVPLLPEYGLHAREVATDRAHLVGRFELSHRLLDAHPEELIGQLALLAAELLDGEVAQFRGFHCTLSCAKRTANLVRIGSFAAASFIASRASFSGIRSISNSTLPGRTTATHCSGAPLPLPIRVSCGFLVIGLSGKTRTQIFPPRAMNRVIATRAASICLSVSQHGSSARSP